MGIKGTPMLDHLGQSFPPVETRTPSSTATLGLPGQPDSVRRAREFTRVTLHSWRLTEQFDTVALVVSELVTNALRHGAACHQNGQNGERPVVELELMRYAARLICAVRDDSDDEPAKNEPADVSDPVAETGRGLYLVDCFSDGWGWRPLSGERQGKIVWAIFTL